MKRLLSVMLAVLTLLSALPLSIVAAAEIPLSIVTQPKSVCVEEGATAEVTFTVTGEGLTYKWFFAYPNGTSFYRTKLGSGTRYAVEMSETYDGYQVYCEITDTYGNTICTDVATVNMLPHDFYGDCDYDCNDCGINREVSAQHVYQNDCDHDCDVCGAVRTAPHTYSNACDTYCNACGSARTPSDHVYTSHCDTLCNECGDSRVVTEECVYTAECDTTCNVCGTERTTLPHTYDNDCDTDCNACGTCRVPYDHRYDNNCDTTCNSCGDLREVPDHVYSNACDTTCNSCRIVREVPDHVYSDPCDRSCNACGLNRTNVSHKYDGTDDPYCNLCGTQKTASRTVLAGSADSALYSDGVLEIDLYNWGYYSESTLQSNVKGYESLVHTIKIYESHSSSRTFYVTQSMMSLFPNLETFTASCYINGFTADAFSANPKLKTVSVTRVGSISSGAFRNCTALESYVQHGDLDYIYENAFQNCTSLKTVEISTFWSKSVSYTIPTIQANTFAGCTALERFACTMVDLKIDTNAFNSCTALKEVVLHEDNIVAGSAFAGTSANIDLYIYVNDQYYSTAVSLSTTTDSFAGANVTIYYPSGNDVSTWLQKAAAGAYGGNVSIQPTDDAPCGANAFGTFDEETGTLTITGTGDTFYVDSVDDGWWYHKRNEIKHLVIGEGITTSLPDDAIGRYNTLESVSLPSTLSTLYSHVFSGCENLTELIIPASLDSFCDNTLYAVFHENLKTLYYVGTEEEWKRIAYYEHALSKGAEVIFLPYIPTTATCTEDGVEGYFYLEKYDLKFGDNGAPITEPAVLTAPGHHYSSCVDETCDRCDETRTDYGHTYDHACDKSCNVCGATRTVGDHVYTNALDPDCNECGVTRDVVQITSQPKSVCVAEGTIAEVTFTATGAGLTYKWLFAYPNGTKFYATKFGKDTRYAVEMSETYDGYQVCCEITDAYGNTIRTDVATVNMLPHVYDNSCDSDCNQCGEDRGNQHVYQDDCDHDCDVCSAVRTAPHVYGNACDTCCNACGAGRAGVPHTYDHDCDVDCNVCGETRTDITHTYDHDCDVDCNVCGDVRTPSGHVYSNACDATCDVCGATRTPSDHVYSNACDATCNVCGAARTPSIHVYDNACDPDCNVCSGIRVPADHVYTADCDATCNVCGAYRVPIDHTYTADCDVDCNVCGDIRTAPSHTYTAICDVDCNKCGAVRTTVDHTYDDVCDKDCNVCGTVRKGIDHVFDDVNDTICNACGDERTTFAISTVEDLYTFSQLVADGEKSLNAILLGDIIVNANADKADFNTWTPIHSYYGTFDGNGYAIRGLYSEEVDRDDMGFFYTNYGVIKNLRLSDVYFRTVDKQVTAGYVGGFCVFNRGTITGCSVAGRLAFVGDSRDSCSQIGGICMNNYGTISYCRNEALVSPSGDDSTGSGGGICCINNGVVEYCYNVAKVSGGADTNDEWAGIDLGGICSDNYGTIRYCYNYGEVRGSSSSGREGFAKVHVGGICAFNGSTNTPGTIQNCFNNGALYGSTRVSGNDGYYSATTYVGGIVAYKTNGSVTGCGNIGSISSNSYAEGGCDAYQGNICAYGSSSSNSRLTTAQYTDGTLCTTLTYHPIYNCICVLCGAGEHGERKPSVTTEPGCATEGVMTYACTICGDSYTEAIPATGEHTYDDEYDADCNVCGDVREVPEKPVDIIYGDADGNGEVTIIDEALVSQYLAGWDVTLNEAAADVDGNGEITIIDEALISQYLAGWDVILNEAAADANGDSQ